MFPSAPTTTDNRKYFPRGLAQPLDGFRFSVDALLLACFAQPLNKCKPVLDLGTGCGVVGLALLLNQPEATFTVHGVDHDPAMIDAAGHNAKSLGLEDRFMPMLLDIRNSDQTNLISPQGYDLVLCNPPYRQKKDGRLPPSLTKQAACFELSAQIDDFIRVAAKNLVPKGRLLMVYLPEHLQRLLAAMQKCKLEPKRLRFVHGRKEKAASLLLVEARKAARPGLRVEPSLILYEQSSRGVVLSDQARQFCPFLACNDSRPQ